MLSNTGLIFGARLSGRLPMSNQFHCLMSGLGFISLILLARKWIKTTTSPLPFGFCMINGLSGRMISMSMPNYSFTSRLALSSKEIVKSSTRPPGNFQKLSSPCWFKRTLLFSTITGPEAIIDPGGSSIYGYNRPEVVPAQAFHLVIPGLVSAHW